MLKLGAAKKEAGKAYALLVIHTPTKDQPVTSETFHFVLDRKKLRQARWREGGYLLRSNIKSDDPGHLWRLYLQLVEVEQAFKELKSDLSIRPIYHQLETRIEAHIFIAFLAYCLLVTLKQRVKTLAPGLTQLRGFQNKYSCASMACEPSDVLGTTRSGWLAAAGSPGRRVAT